MSKHLIRALSFLILIVGFMIPMFTVGGLYSITVDGKLGLNEWKDANLQYIVTENSNTGTSVDVAYVEWFFDEDAKQLFAMFFIQDTLASKSNSFGITGYINNTKVFTLNNNKSEYCASGYSVNYAFNVLGNGNGYMVEVILDLPNVPDNLTLGVSITDPNAKTTPKSNIKIFVRETTTAKPTTTKKVTTTKAKTTTTKVTTTKKPTTTKVSTTKVTTTKPIAEKDVSTTKSNNIKSTSPIGTTSKSSVSASTSKINNSSGSKSNIKQKIRNFIKQTDPTETEDTYEFASDELIGTIEDDRTQDNYDTESNNKIAPASEISGSELAKRITATLIATLMIAGAIVLVIFASKKKNNGSNSEK